MIRPLFRLAAAAVLLLFAIPGARAGVNAGSPEAGALRGLIQPGEKASAFALEDIDGRTVSVKPGEGKPTLFVFFSAFCPLCRELAPSVRELASRHEGSIRIVGVNLDGKRFRNAVRQFVTESGFTFPVLLDEIRDDLFVASDRYGIEKTPTAVLVDGRGSVRGAYAAEAMRDFLRDFDRIRADSEKGNGVAK